MSIKLISPEIIKIKFNVLFYFLILYFKKKFQSILLNNFHIFLSSI